MESIKIVGVSLVALFAIMLLRQTRPEMSVLLKSVVTVVFAAFALSMLTPLMSLVTELSALGGASEYLSAVFKGLAIAVTVQIGASVCRDCGENTVASALELVGKAELLLLSLPMLNDILNIAKELLKI